MFSASALAGIGLIRNIAGAGFPLFARQMFLNEGYQWAGTILAFLSCVLVPIPFILSKYGRALRMRSPWAKQHMDDLTEAEGESIGIQHNGQVKIGNGQDQAKRRAGYETV